MKAATPTVLLLLLIAPCSAMSPVTRVVELLQGMTKKIQEESKAEEDMYESFVCWGNSVIKTKTASNEAAQSRVDMLEAYISDLDNGRIELTTERVDLEKEISGLSQDIETAEAQRAKEHEDYLAAKDEMEQAIAALEKATEILAESTKGAHEGTLLSVRTKMNEGYKQRQTDALSLDRAISFGKRFLTPSDALFLERVLSAEVPVVDWKKLNRKATFKMKYKARSLKIQDVLAKLLETFRTNLAETEAKEKAALETFEKLMKAKKEQLEQAQAALAEMAVENGAKAMSREESVAEVDELKAQITNDNKFIDQVTKQLEEKKLEWKDRKNLRRGEIEAISKAISILHSDDARDLFKKSFKSQGYLFLQTSSKAIRMQASRVLVVAGQQAHDQRLLALAMSSALRSTGHFDEVIAAIDKMITTLKAEGETDLKQKEECEKSRAENTRDAQVKSRTIDELTDKITKLESEIAEMEAEIKEKNEAIATLQQELKEATELRAKENAEWKASDADDKAAAELVNNAKEVLASFYSDNKLVLAQQAPYVYEAVEAGKAPPPPPTTWEAPYGGKTDEQNGIVAILEMIHEDIVRDYQAADAAEKQAQADFDKYKEETLSAVKELEAAIAELTKVVGEKKQEVQDTKDEKTAVKESLDAVIKTLKDLAMGCDFIGINFARRGSNRAIEVDGLIKAKAILEGAAYGTAPDPDREIKPGDALLQKA